MGLSRVLHLSCASSRVTAARRPSNSTRIWASLLISYAPVCISASTVGIDSHDRISFCSPYPWEGEVSVHPRTTAFAALLVACFASAIIVAATADDLIKAVREGNIEA